MKNILYGRSSTRGNRSFTYLFANYVSQEELYSATKLDEMPSFRGGIYSTERANVRASRREGVDCVNIRIQWFSNVLNVPTIIPPARFHTNFSPTIRELPIFFPGPFFLNYYSLL